MLLIASIALAIAFAVAWLVERRARRAAQRTVARLSTGTTAHGASAPPQALADTRDARETAPTRARDAAAATTHEIPERTRDLVAAAHVAQQSAFEAQTELSAAHEKFAAFMDNLPYPAFIQDERGEFAFVNAAGAADTSWREATAQAGAGSRGASSGTVSVSGPARHYFWLRFPLRVARHEWLGGMAIDITHRVRAERALTERTGELETLFQHVPAPLWIARDAHGDEIIGNPAADELLGIAGIAHGSDAAAAQFLRDGRPLQRGEVPIRLAIRERCIVNGTDMEVARPDGTRRHVSITAAPLFGVDGEVRGAVAAAVDISQLKVYEAELERAVRRRDEFLAVLAHELRNPLAPIRNSVQILQRVPGDIERVRRATVTIDRQTSQIVRLIDDLLDVARISQGLVELDIAPRYVTAIVDGALDVVREQSDKSGHTIVVEHQAPDAVALVDALRAEQILVNILSNALKYSLPRTRVSVKTWCDDDSVCIAVTDEGQGIPPEFLREIFTMFARPGLDAKSRISGMGVGLALAKQLAEQHGGSIAVASEGRGRGATFTVTFPRATPATDVIAA